MSQKISDINNELILDNIEDGIISIDRDENILFINKKAQEITGFTKTQARRRKLKDVLKVIYKDKGQIPIDTISNDYMRYTIISNHVTKRNVFLKRVKVFHEDEKQTGSSYIISIQDRCSKYRDQLTGLINRVYMEKHIKNLQAKQEIPLSIIIGDINGLKYINDTYGYDMGDAILIQVAKYFKKSCRRNDLIARWGGDEFIIVLANACEEVSSNICNKIKNACKLNNTYPFEIDISLGYSVKKDLYQSISEIINEAEEYMQRRKLLQRSSGKSAIISSLKITLFERSQETVEHAKRLEKYSLKIGNAIGLSENRLDDLSLIALLHDIGKIGIPDQYLKKKDKLSKSEWEMMKTHSDIGYRIAISSEQLCYLAHSIRAIHERWDGLGYPNGLIGEDIPLLSRIISIVDAYDVMTNGRPYKEPIPHELALKELSNNAGSQFDPNLIKIFLQVMGQ